MTSLLPCVSSQAVRGEKSTVEEKAQSASDADQPMERCRTLGDLSQTQNSRLIPEGENPLLELETARLPQT